MHNEESLLALSGIQHFAFCRRQWALIHLEQQWVENALTVEGNLMHHRAHDKEIKERRGDTIIARGLHVHSWALGLSGVCDVVEFHANNDGHPLVGEDGLWLPCPVEYKRGHSKRINADRLQLCAQAVCLEEMFGCDVSFGFLYYGSTHSREKVVFNEELRSTVAKIAQEMHSLYERQYTPKASYSSMCKSCSLLELCEPKISAKTSVNDYLLEHAKELL